MGGRGVVDKGDYFLKHADFRYGLQDDANCSNGALLELQIQQGKKIEEVFAEKTVGVGKWAPPQSVDITFYSNYFF
jgi:hypothetical protein